MPLHIPRDHRDGVTHLIRLGDEDFDRLVRSLESAPPAISPWALAHSIAPDAALDVAPLTELLTALISLIVTVKRSSETSSDTDAAKQVARAASSLKLGDLTPGSPGEVAFADRVARFLGLAEKLAITSKASSVYFAHEHLFRYARILSDIRTIFGPDDETQPVAAMIVHHLELTCDTRSYTAMNIHDLRELRRAIDRAIEKDTALRRIISQGGLQYLEDIPQEHQR